eukprot:m.87472 g.87472  ORF g.87472 m.87472 type:complete len:247 (-) comp14778_c0_seq14:1064-1804(-)
MSRISDIHLALRRTGDSEDLDLRFIQLSPQDIERLLTSHLAHRKHIQQLWLHGCCLRAIGAKRLASSMSKTPQLTHISLSDNCIPDDGLTALSDGIEQGTLPNLYYLSLRDNPLTSKAVPALLQLILPSTGYKGVTELSLEGCQIGDDGCASLLEGMNMSPPPRLEVLVMSETGFASAATTALAHLLTHTELTLVELLLSGNPLWTTHAAQLMPALYEAKHLRSLSLPRASHPDVDVPRHINIAWT